MTRPNDPRRPVDPRNTWNADEPHTAEFVVPEGGYDAPPPGYVPNPHYPQQPAYDPGAEYAPEPAPKKSSKPVLVTIIALLILALFGLFGVVFAYRSGLFGGGSTPQEVVVVTEYTDAPPEDSQPTPPGSPEDGERTDGERTDGERTDGERTDGERTDTERPSPGEEPPAAEQSTLPPPPSPLPEGGADRELVRNYREFRPDTRYTSQAFAENVYVEYMKAYRSAKRTNLVLSVKSPVTEERYTMRCAGTTEVVCEGGNNARVIIW